MPGMDGIALHKTLTAQGITIPVIIITGHGDVGMAVEAVQRGALDLIEKPFRAQPLLERINQALVQDAEAHHRRADEEAIAARLTLLTERQRQVMSLVVSGETTKSIAMALGISPKTVDHHRAQIMEKMRARSVIDLARKVEAMGSTPQASQHCAIDAPSY